MENQAAQNGNSLKNIQDVGGESANGKPGTSLAEDTAINKEKADIAENSSSPNDPKESAVEKSGGGTGIGGTDISGEDSATNETSRNFNPEQTAIDLGQKDNPNYDEDRRNNELI